MAERITPEEVRDEGKRWDGAFNGEHDAEWFYTLATQMEADKKLIADLAKDIKLRAKDASDYALGLRQRINENEERIVSLVAMVERLRKTLVEEMARRMRAEHVAAGYIESFLLPPWNEAADKCVWIQRAAAALRGDDGGEQG